LKIASQKLIIASDPASVLNTALLPASRPTSQKPPARKKLDSGPARAMLNSSSARVGSRPIRETPPNTNRVIETTGIL
jgi:hypothetical protein